jgi:hypothetical protein
MASQRMGDSRRLISTRRAGENDTSAFYAKLYARRAGRTSVEAAELTEWRAHPADRLVPGTVGSTRPTARPPAASG